MTTAPAPLYLLLSILCAAYLGLALADKRAAGSRLGYALVAFLLLLCGRVVLSYGVSPAALPSEMLAALTLPRAVTALLGAWLAVMAAGELARAVLARRPAGEAVGPAVLLLAGGLLADPGAGAGVGLGLAASALAAVEVWGSRRPEPPGGEGRSGSGAPSPETPER